MRTLKLTIEYDGSNYCGWQRQKNGKSIQETIEGAVRKMTREETKLIGASRTDAGVHALAQVAHFRTGTTIPRDGFVRGLNSILPHDIRIRDAEEAPENFHAINCAAGKTYRYVIHTDRVASALNHDRAWHVHEKLDMEAMRSASRHFIGTHDFRAFMASGSSVLSTVRTIREIRLTRRARPSGKSSLMPSVSAGISIDITGDGFLRHMVRNIVGTLVEVGRGKIARDDVKSIIEEKKRKAAGVCAPPCGLYLMHVYYYVDL